MQILSSGISPKWKTESTQLQKTGTSKFIEKAANASEDLVAVLTVVKVARYGGESSVILCAEILFMI